MTQRQTKEKAKRKRRNVKVAAGAAMCDKLLTTRIADCSLGGGTGKRDAARVLVCMCGGDEMMG